MSGTDFGAGATIHRFPKGGRGGLRVVHPLVTNVVAFPRFAPNIMAEGGWYHQEAMREEAERAAKDKKPN